MIMLKVCCCGCRKCGSGCAGAPFFPLGDTVLHRDVVVDAAGTLLMVAASADCAFLLLPCRRGSVAKAAEASRIRPQDRERLGPKGGEAAAVYANAAPNCVVRNDANNDSHCNATQDGSSTEYTKLNFYGDLPSAPVHVIVESVFRNRSSKLAASSSVANGKDGLPKLHHPSILRYRYGAAPPTNASSSTSYHIPSDPVGVQCDGIPISPAASSKT